MSTVVTSLARVVVLLLAATVAVLVTSGDAAGQAPLCDTATPTVTDAAQLDDAISCYNAQIPAGDHTITFGGDIVHATGTPTITQADVASMLTVDGANFKLTGPGAAALPSGLINLFTVAGAAPVSFMHLELEDADADAIVANAGAGIVSISDSSIHDNGFGVRVRAGSTTLSNTTLHDNGIDSFGFAGSVTAVGGTIEILDSTISNNGGRGIWGNGGTVVVSNSTLSNNFRGVLVSSGTVLLSNSTVVDSATNGLTHMGGSLTVVSSVVANNLGGDCSGTAADGGNNFASDATCSSFTSLTAGSLSTAADNGCASQTPVGCVNTTALLPGSNAIDGGLCAGVVIGIDPLTATHVVGDLTTDQRGSGFPRTIGGGCEPGAFEAAACLSSTPTVVTAVALDHAIACYNVQLPAGDHTVTFGGDIIHTTGTPAITQSDTDFSLVIEGQNNQLANSVDGFAFAPLFTASAAAPVTFNEIDLVAVIEDGIAVGPDAGQVSIATTSIQQFDSGDVPDSGAGVQVNGGSVSITNSTLHTNWIGLEVLGGSVAVSDSTINNNSAGVFLRGGSVSIASSTIHDNVGNNVGVSNGAVSIADSTISNVEPGGSVGVGLANGSVAITNSVIRGTLYGVIVSDSPLASEDAVVTISGSTIVETQFTGVWVGKGSVSISNSTITGGATAVSARDDGSASGSVSISNSTIAHNQLGLLQLGGGQLSIASSVVGDNDAECDGVFFDGGNNFASDNTCGAGFALLSPASLSALADNGCATPNPEGCVETAALQAMSNAIGGGDCTGVVVGLDVAGAAIIDDLTTDQRGDGFQRTLGANCDAGAFEVTLLTDFVDVPADSAFYTDAVTWAKSNGITTGTTTTMFSPNGTVTRAQMATFLWRYAGEPAPAAGNPFTDVPNGVFFTDAVTWLAETGVTNGTSATTFSPHDPLTRAQMATFLWRFAGEPPPTQGHPFTDVPDGQYYTVPVTWLAETGITTGTTATTFSPNDPLTRGQAVTFLHRFAQHPPVN